jgi:hypothetical protein
MATGENSNTWGGKTNNNLNLLEQAITGYEAITLASASSTYSLSVADASASPGRNAFIEFKGTVASAISIVIPDIEKGYWVKNSATGSPLIFRTSSGTGVTLPTNQWVFLISDGASVVDTTPTSLTNYARLNANNSFSGENIFTDAVTILGEFQTSSIIASEAFFFSTVNIANASVSGSFTVSGVSTFTSVVNVRANLSVTGATNLVGNVVVSGVATLASAVDIKGATSLASTLVVGGNTTLNGSVSVSGSFAVSGASTFTSVVNIRANASVVGNFLVSGSTILASAVDIRGATSLASTLVVAGNATFNSNVSVSGTLTLPAGSRIRTSGPLTSEFNGHVDFGPTSVCFVTFRPNAVSQFQGPVRIDTVIVSCSNTTFFLTDFSMISFSEIGSVNPRIYGTGTSATQNINIVTADAGIVITTDIGIDSTLSLYANNIVATGFFTVSAGRFNVDTSTVFTSGVQIEGSAVALGSGQIPEGSQLLVIYNGTAPVSSTADGVILYAQDIASSSELRVRDEAGNVTTLSPHNFQLCGGPSEDLAWSYYGEKNGKAINVDMLKLARVLEKLSGEKLVYVGDAP